MTPALVLQLHQEIQLINQMMKLIIMLMALMMMLEIRKARVKIHLLIYHQSVYPTFAMMIMILHQRVRNRH